MPALTNLPQTLRTTLLTLPVAVNDSSPFAVPAKPPLARSRLAVPRHHRRAARTWRSSLRLGRRDLSAHSLEHRGR